ncbi:hypothetical protein [Acinetobacter baumannii]|uniref:hypothetical protein n=1 Tax=Acinetobacter baumannii TaxID=470 RepID=UPI001D179679|nr:hypothetical protein [Acinetobacter baumannii]
MTYFVDSAGNPIFDNGKDPAIEMNGKIYDGEWQVKGNVISETYGAPPTGLSIKSKTFNASMIRSVKTDWRCRPARKG